MIHDDPKQKAHTSRRGLLKTFGLATAGAVLAEGIGGGRAASAVAPSGARTEILRGTDGSVVLVSGPFPGFALPGGARFGICLVCAGAVRSRGRLGVVAGVERVALDLGGLGELEVDRGVAQGVYRMLDAFSVERPVELFGFSAVVAPQGVTAGGSVELTWEAKLRGSAVTYDRLRQELEGYHAVVLGLVAEDSRFTGQLSYVEIRQVS